MICRMKGLHRVMVSCVAWIGLAAASCNQYPDSNQQPPFDCDWSKLKVVSVCPPCLGAGKSQNGRAQITLNHVINDVTSLKRFSALTSSLKGDWKRLSGPISLLPDAVFEASTDSGQSIHFMFGGSGVDIFASEWAAKLSYDQATFLRVLAQGAYEQNESLRR